MPFTYQARADLLGLFITAVTAAGLAAFAAGVQPPVAVRRRLAELRDGVRYA